LFDRGPILMFFAHPDDETLAAGATIHKLTRSGAEVWIAIAATGALSREGATTEDVASLREDCKRAASVLGIPGERVIFGDFPDNAMDSLPLLSVNKWLESIVARTRPATVVTHHQRCTNIDHRYCFEAATVATRPAAGRHIALLSGEIVSSTGYLRPAQFEPNLYVRVEEADIDAKCRAIACYASEIHRPPHPRSVEVLRALSVVRGSEGGYPSAEAFMMIRDFA
jgi:LmbE family N-acetylglucosaminyl deacetylase